MMYSEFAEHVGCKDNEYNHEVFENLEILYMNSNITKEKIYEYGKKLVDNSKTEEEIAFENDINEQIADLKEQLKAYREEEKRYMQYYKEEKEAFGLTSRAKNYWKDQAKWQKELARRTKRRIADLQWVLGI